jgi:hypothetical protein
MEDVDAADTVRGRADRGALTLLARRA